MPLGNNEDELDENPPGVAQSWRDWSYDLLGDSGRYWRLLFLIFFLWVLVAGTFLVAGGLYLRSEPVIATAIRTFAVAIGVLGSVIVGAVWTGRRGERSESPTDFQPDAADAETTPVGERRRPEINWTWLSLASGFAGSALAAALIAVRSNSWRIVIAVIVGAGVATGYLVLRANPAKFYRRLVSWWFASGCALLALSYAADGRIESEWLVLDFKFGNELPGWWWIVWAVVLVALLVADFLYRRDHDVHVIDLRLRERRTNKRSVREQSQ